MATIDQNRKEDLNVLKLMRCKRNKAVYQKEKTSLFLPYDEISLYPTNHPAHSNDIKTVKTVQNLFQILNEIAMNLKLRYFYL